MELEQAVVEDIRPLSPLHFALALRAPRVAAAASPGQFVHVRVAEALDPLLRRPFGISQADPGEGSLRLLVQVVGRGTECLARRRPGDPLDLLGPLGRGFAPPGRPGAAVLVAGGVGVAPFPFLARRLAAERPVTALVGAASRDYLLAEDALREAGAAVEVATEDGSAGRRGLVTDLLARHLEGAAMVYACGPTAMLRRVAEICRAAGVPCQVSLDGRMACGSGACLGCAVRTRSGDGHGSPYAKVCRDGPVFPAEEVLWDA